jgi:hypothetical protein
MVRDGYAILVVIIARGAAPALRAFDLEGHRDTQDGQLAVTIS